MAARCVGVLLAFLAGSFRLHSQSSPATASLAGRVVQAGDSTISAVGADIEIVGTSLRRYANGSGRFLFSDVVPGHYEMRIRAVGYQPVALRVDLVAGRSAEQRIELNRLPNALTEVVIEGKRVRVPARYEDVFRRAGRGVGKFFTSADIEQIDAYEVKSILGRVPTVSINDYGVTFRRCEAGIPSAIISGASVRAMTPKVQVYIDGVRMTRGGDTEELNNILRSVHPREIEIMEVYTGVARIPGEFNNDACAVIAIWTKSR